MQIGGIFENRSFQKFSSVCAMVIGGAGMLSGVFLAARGHFAALGILPAAGMFAIGLLGLHGSRTRRPN